MTTSFSPTLACSSINKRMQFRGQVIHKPQPPLGKSRVHFIPLKSTRVGLHNDNSRSTVPSKSPQKTVGSFWQRPRREAFESLPFSLGLKSQLLAERLTSSSDVSTLGLAFSPTRSRNNLFIPPGICLESGGGRSASLEQLIRC